MMTKEATIKSDPFAALADARRWISWSSIDRNGRATKMPFCASGPASSINPGTWATRAEAAALAEARGHDGVGIVLGELDSGDFLIGLDLDTCRDPGTGALEDWAQVAVECFGSYTEVSPSKTGLKVFALASAEAIEAVREDLTKGGAKTWKGGTGEHPPCIDLYTNGRYFTVTGWHLDGAPESLAHVDAGQLQRLIDEIGPALSGKRAKRAKRPAKPTQAETAAKVPVQFAVIEGGGEMPGMEALTRWARSSRAPHCRQALKLLERGECDFQADTSRSGGEFAFARFCRLAGLSESQFREAIAEWTARGFGYGPGDDRDFDVRSRALSRCWENNEDAAPDPFILDAEESCLWYFDAKEGDGGAYVRLAGWIKPLYEMEDPHGKSERLFEIITRKGCTRRVILPSASWAGRKEDFIPRLAEAGLFIAADKNSTARLRAFINAGRLDHARHYSRTGWVSDHVFALPDRAFSAGNLAGEALICLEGAEHGYSQKGTLADWQEGVARFAVGNSRLMLAMSAAFCGPFLMRAMREGGGVHLRGGSSTGKTTALHAAASVWGGRDFLRTWRATANGLEGVAEAHTDTLLCLDEMGQVSGRDAGASAYMLANGQGKARASREGDARRSKTWRVIFLSTGELSLADKIAEDARGRQAAGQEVRVLDLPADAGAGLGLFETLHGKPGAAALADHIRQAAGAHYGHAGPAFLEWLVPRIDQAVETFRVRCRIFEDHTPEGADGQIRRAAGRFAMIAAAGEAAIEAGVAPWPAGEPTRAAERCFADWLEARGGCHSAEDRNAVDYIRAFIEAHGASRFQADDAIEPAASLRDRVGVVVERDDGVREWAFFAEAWKQVCRQGGLDPEAAARALRDAGAIETGRDGRLTKKRKVAGIGHPRCYVISSAIFDN